MQSMQRGLQLSMVNILLHCKQGVAYDSAVCMLTDYCEFVPMQDAYLAPESLIECIRRPLDFQCLCQLSFVIQGHLTKPAVRTADQYRQEVQEHSQCKTNRQTIPVVACLASGPTAALSSALQFISESEVAEVFVRIEQTGMSCESEAWTRQRDWGRH